MKNSQKTAASGRAKEVKTYKLTECLSANFELVNAGQEG